MTINDAIEELRSLCREYEFKFRNKDDAVEMMRRVEETLSRYAIPFESDIKGRKISFAYPENTTTHMIFGTPDIIGSGVTADVSAPFPHISEAECSDMMREMNRQFRERMAKIEAKESQGEEFADRVKFETRYSYSDEEE